MEKSWYSIVFQNMSELIEPRQQEANPEYNLDLLQSELEEIDELRQLSLLISEPDSIDYTTT